MSTMSCLRRTFCDYRIVWSALGTLIAWLLQIQFDWLAPIWCWVKDYETLSAGILGLTGGAIAFLGIKIQTNETRRQVTITNMRTEHSVITKIEREYDEKIVEAKYLKEMADKTWRTSSNHTFPNALYNLRIFMKEGIKKIEINPYDEIYTNDNIIFGMSVVNMFIENIKYSADYYCDQIKTKEKTTEKNDLCETIDAYIHHLEIFKNEIASEKKRIRNYIYSTYGG